ncbi:hypothetical protein PMI14_06361 [Acidovorax sp. CF316]|uniref:hypothetical protein n=1 Tax=Acidovorax sp. CF316 TaxID=1144317 RepID=UPI00026BEC85|nr:hypothetical protein [Acidovorax sp. CF316]EJE49162.1 hypothetical protein PMI14_06361 [Acidovorax sp. CF316]
MVAPASLHIPLALLALSSLAFLAGCSAPAPTARGEVRGAPTTAGELAQSDVNRMATLAMRDNLASLYLLMDKLYRRNPAEWRKSGAASREQAMEQVRAAVEQRQPWAPLQGRRDIAGLAFALAPEFAGDRVAAFIAATADMLVTAHGGKTEFFLLDSLDAQHLYNAARNVESAVWLLSQRRNGAGQPLLWADEIGPQGRNLSFEREFGKLIARLDLVAVVVTEKYRRAAISYVQGIVGGTFLQFLPVR